MKGKLIAILCFLTTIFMFNASIVMSESINICQNAKLCTKALVVGDEKAGYIEKHTVSQWKDIPSKVMTSDGMARVIIKLFDPEIELLMRESKDARNPFTESYETRKSKQKATKVDAALSEAVSEVGNRVLKALPEGEYRLNRKYNYMPFLAVDISSEGLDRLMLLPEVQTVQPDIPDPLPDYQLSLPHVNSQSFQRDKYNSSEIPRPSMDDTIQLIGADDAWEKGYTGDGWHVAVLDTGIRSTHEFFQGKEILEACFSSNADCPNDESEMIGSGAAAHYPERYAGHDHGTHVTGTAAGKKPDNTLFGVAKDADIIAVNVFSKFYDDDCGDHHDYCVLSYRSDQIAGLDYVYGLRTSLQIGSVNMSLGGGYHTEYCNNDTRKSAIDLLRGVNIPTAIATGNNGYCGAVGAPSCISTAIAVMASDKGDNETYFNNWHAVVADLFAPGHLIYSATGDSDDSYAEWSGTSMATPHVAGGLTLMRQFQPEDEVDYHLSRLIESGPEIETKCGGDHSKPRIYVDNFAEDVSPSLPGVMMLLLEDEE